MMLKTTRLFFISFFLFVFHPFIIAQTDYGFRDAILVSGTGLQTGSKYKFSNVKPGVDGFITIVTEKGGARLVNIDDNTQGFTNAFQPAIQFEKNAEGYIEFRIDFVDAVTGDPKIEETVPVTCINVDGATYNDGMFQELDKIQFFPGHYDFLVTGNKLSITLPTGWVAVQNTSGAGYPYIDTVTRDLMATIVNKKISGFLIRAGGNNTSSSVPGLKVKSFYFKNFGYGHLTTLPNRTMLSLSGFKKQNTVEIRGLLSSSHSYDKLIIERAVTANVFGSIGKFEISGQATSQYSFLFTDIKPENGVNYYRVRLVGSNSAIQEISNTLIVKMNNDKIETKILNNVLQGSYPVISISSAGDQEAGLQVSDFSGRVVNTLKVKLNTGVNNIFLPGLNIAKGYLILSVTTRDGFYNQKIMMQ